MDINGTLWVFNRIDLARWRVRTSTAWSTSGVTWAAEKPYVHSTDDKQMYTAAVNVGTTVRTACSNHPVNGAGLQGVYYGEINTIPVPSPVRMVRHSERSAPRSTTAPCKGVRARPAGWSTWIYDVGDNPSIRELRSLSSIRRKGHDRDVQVRPLVGVSLGCHQHRSCRQTLQCPLGRCRAVLRLGAYPRAHRAVSSTSPVNPVDVVHRASYSAATGATWTPPCSDRSRHPRQNIVASLPGRRRRLVPCRGRLRADVPLEHV